MADTKAEEQDIILVGKRNDDSRAVWDRHPYHPSNYGEPEGEVFISDMRPYEVHRSPGIQQKLGEKELQELGERVAGQRRSAWEEEQEKKAEVRRQIRAAAEDAPPGATPMYLPAASQPQQTTPQYTNQGGLDASAHPVTAVENEPGGVGDTSAQKPQSSQELLDRAEADADEAQARAAADDDTVEAEEEAPDGTVRRVRRPRQSGERPER